MFSGEPKPYNKQGDPLPGNKSGLEKKKRIPDEGIATRIGKIKEPLTAVLLKILERSMPRSLLNVQKVGGEKS